LYAWLPLLSLIFLLYAWTTDQRQWWARFTLVSIFNLYTHYQAGDIGQAIATYERALELEPGNASARKRLDQIRSSRE
jgi:hypothetical protein